MSTLALTGVIPFAGFWSKDEIIDNVGANGYTVLFWVGLVGAAMTAMYMTRATYLTFFGQHVVPLPASMVTTTTSTITTLEEQLELATVGAPEGDSGTPKSLGAAANTHDDHHDDDGPHKSAS